MIKLDPLDPLIHPPGKGAKYLFDWRFRWGDNVSRDAEMDYENKIKNWCSENLKGQYEFGQRGVYIYEEDDAMLMKLRWE